MVGLPAKTAKTFHYAGSYICRGRIDHRVMVGKRNIAQELTVVVPIECRPSAVAILHAQQPLYASAHGAIQALLVRKFHPLQGHQNERGIVYVRVVVIAKLKGPS